MDLDVLQQIINVNWGGKAVFVATNGVNVFHGEIKAKEPPQEGTTVKWTELPMSQFNFTDGTPYPGDKELTTCSGLSYAVVGEQDTSGQTIGKSVFIMCGLYRGTEDTADTGSVFFKSNDGVSWMKTHVVPDIYIPFWEFAPGKEEINWASRESVWDTNAKAFYVAGPANKAIMTHAGRDVFRGEIMYSSPDGEHWAKESENYIPDSAQAYSPDRYPSPSAILQHCIKPENAGPMPDGYQAYSADIDNGTRIKSGGSFKYVTSVGVRIQPDEPGTRPPASVTIERNVEGGAPPPLPSPPSAITSDDCFCVACARGVWAAGLGSIIGNEATMAIDISTDAGKTWENVLQDERSPIVFIIGGELVGLE